MTQVGGESALANGAAPALKELTLDGNPASAAAEQAVKDALEQRASRKRLVSEPMK